jgi:hypothetical protein
VTDARPPRSDRIYGAVALVMIGLAVFFALRGGTDDGAVPGVPTLRILSPQTRTLATQPLTLVFDAGTPLRPGPMGWSAGGRHVHVRVGGNELMGGVGDLQPEGGSRYRWTLPRLPSGIQRVQLFWSDASHRPMRTGASVPVVVQLP